MTRKARKLTPIVLEGKKINPGKREQHSFLQGKGKKRAKAPGRPEMSLARDPQLKGEKKHVCAGGKGKKKSVPGTKERKREEPSEKTRILAGR